MSSVVTFLKHKSMSIIESRMGGMNSLLQIITLLVYITKSSWRQSTHNEETKYTKIEIFKNIQHLIKACLHVDCLQDDFVM